MTLFRLDDQFYLIPESASRIFLAHIDDSCFLSVHAACRSLFLMYDYLIIDGRKGLRLITAFHLTTVACLDSQSPDLSLTASHAPLDFLILSLVVYAWRSDTPTLGCSPGDLTAPQKSVCLFCIGRVSHI